MKRIPLFDASAPVACTITEAEVPERLELIERIRTNLDRLDRTEAGMVLHFPARSDIEADLRKFAVDEKRCCEFWGFEVVQESDGLAFRWEAPPDAAGLVDRLASFLTGSEPASSLRGLL